MKYNNMKRNLLLKLTDINILLTGKSTWLAKMVVTFLFLQIDMKIIILDSITQYIFARIRFMVLCFSFNSDGSYLKISKSIKWFFGFENIPTQPSKIKMLYYHHFDMDIILEWLSECTTWENNLG